MQVEFVQSQIALSHADIVIVERHAIQESIIATLFQDILYLSKVIISFLVELLNLCKV